MCGLLFFQLCLNKDDDDKKISRVFGTLLAVSVLTMHLWTYLVDKGSFGKPGSLNEACIYQVVDVVSNDDSSTFVILRDARGKNIPIKFSTKVQKDLVNQFCKLIGEDEKTYNLVSLK